MLTTKTITPQQGKFYYAKENYYSTEEQQEHSRWFGVGTLELKLSGEVKPEVFQNLLDGYLPKGEKFRTRKPTRKGYKERAGLDCTFCAPKSVSILALIKGDLKLEIAHRSAVERTLKILEERYATTRVRTDSGRKVVKTGNLVVGQFHHDTSRELDPHLHTHCVILNMTQLPNGKWYSLRDDEIHYNKKLLGKIYQNELALEVQKLGYAIELTVHGQFEIKGVNREHIEYFSKRREQIKALLKEDSSWDVREKVWDLTRRAKTEPIPRHELMAYWQSEIKDLGLVCPKPEKNQTPHKKAERHSGKLDEATAIFSPKKTVSEAVEEGIFHASERAVAFKLEAIENFILEEVGNFSHAEVVKAIVDKDELLYLDKQKVTTQQALLRELETIKLMLAGKQQVTPIAQNEYLESHLEELSLTPGQRDALFIAATTTDRFLAWEGVAGAGKTFALNQFGALAQDNGYVLKGFAPSSAAASVLADELNIETNTVARLLCSRETTDSEKQIWIVDEAGLLSANDAHALLQRATLENARVILVGDTRQLSAVEAGNPFKSLQQAGIKTAYLNQSLRQKTADLKQAVDLIATGQIQRGINLFTANNRIIEIESQEFRHDALITDYMTLAPDERENTLLLAGTNAERLIITQKIRSAQKEEGSLGEIATVSQLVPKDLTRVQMRYTHNFKKGDVVVPIYGSKKKGLEKGTQYLVVDITKDLLTLSHNGKIFRVNTDFALTVYTSQELELAIGDKLKWTKNDHKLGRRNGQEFALASIEGKTATIEYPGGKLEDIDLDELQHLDYALVSTIYSSQGKTSDRVLIATDNTIASESFYVAVSRAKHDLKLYTADIKKFTENVLKSRAKENPIELLKQKLIEQHAREVKVGAKEMDSAEQIKKLQCSQKQLSELTHPSKAQKTEISWIARTLKSWVAASSLDVGDVVTDREKTGKITDWFIKGELVQAIVQWSGWPPIPEDPARLYIVEKSLKNASTHESTNPFKSESIDGEDIGRRAGERLDPSSREVRQAGSAARIAKPRIDPPNSRAFQTKPGVERDEGGYSRDRKRSQGTSREFERAKQDFQAILERVRAIPLEEVAQRLGLERDRHDKHKWVSSEPFVRLSINNSKFFDHKAQKGGGGAIDLTMHLRGCSFIDAVQWLDSGALDLVKRSVALPTFPLTIPTPPTLPTPPTSSTSSTSSTPSIFVPPALDVSTWSAVKEYLTLKRGLPEKLVNELNQQGIIYADRLQNAVFIRKNIDGEITGASLRGTYKDSHFKGLAKNSDRSRGWFSLSIGSGELERIVLVESAIDAISAAALSHKNRKTLFISTDGAGAVPVEWLQQHLAQGVSVLIGYDRDRAGEEMAWAMVHSLLGVTQRAVTKSISSKVVSPNPLAALKPLNEAVANRMVKDLAMAGVSTQFIGMEAAPLHTPSSTRNYRLAWGERANTGNYTARDVIMVSGSGPWRSVTTEQIEQTFNNHYVPLLEKAIAASSQFVVGNAKGTDRLVQKFLTERGFKLETTKDNYTIATPLAIRQQLPGVTRYTPTLGKDWNEQLLFIEQNNTPSDELNVSSWKTMAKALAKEDRYIRHIEEVTLPLTQGQPLSDRALNALRLDEKTYKEIQTQLWQWLGAANALGKSEAYLRRIAEVAMEFNSIKPKALKEQAKTAMQQDFAQYRELLSISLAPELLLEASNTAAKVRTFLFKHGTMHSDQSIIFTSNQWRMELNGEAKAIVNNEHREILRVEGEKVVVFNPLPEERELMRELCAQMELERQQENFQQSEQETDRRRGRGR